MPELKRPAGELRIGPYRPRMAREPRIEVPGGIYHVGSKGNRGCVIYEDDFERRIFLRLLTVVTKRFGWTCHAYVLMSNHFHLLVQLHVGGLSAGMQLLNGCFAKFSNRKNGYLGQHLFRNRFWSEFVVPPPFLAATQDLRLFGSTPSAARRAYREFVHDGIGAPAPRCQTQ